MTHNLFPQLVTLNAETHEYTDGDGNVFMGFSKFCDNFLTRPFNSAGASYGVAKASINKGEIISAASVLEKWDEQRNLGVRVDEALSRQFKKQEHLDTDKDIVDLVHSVVNEYAEYKEIYNQVVTYNTQYMIAGSPDTFVLTSNRADGQFIISDFKTFEKQDNLHEHKGWIFPPLNHLSHTKYLRIALQLSYYAFQLEGLLGKRCKKLFIHLINPTTQTHQKIVVPYMKSDILVLLETHKERIKELNYKPKESLF